MNHIPRVAPLRRIMREAAMSTENNPPPAEQLAPPTFTSVATSDAVASDEHRRVWKSDDLLGADTEALILHRGQTYRLRCTKQGKLILYK
jgi:hemin uptake protein HemP